MSRPSALIAVFCLVAPAAVPASPAGADVTVAAIGPAEFLSARVRIALCDALGDRDDAGDTRGRRLADYASRPAGDPERHESTRLAARRIVAESPLALQAPDATAVWLLAAARQLERAGAEAVDAARRRELQLTAQLARFHGRRLIAAVRYNLFRRALSLPELYAAVRQEKNALAVWEELVRLAPDDDRGRAWRTDLARLQENVRELEAQCCPPHPDAVGAAVWRPLTD